MNLTDQYQGKRITVVTTGLDGTTQEKEILVGNCKGVLLVKAGTENHPCYAEEMYNIHQSISEAFKNADDTETLICTIPHYVSIEYIKM